MDQGLIKTINKLQDAFASVSSSIIQTIHNPHHRITLITSSSLGRRFQSHRSPSNRRHWLSILWEVFGTRELGWT